jgi:hypothetical protein
VLGSAAIAALLNARLAAELPGFDTQAAEQASAGSSGMPPQVLEGFTAAMSQSMWLPILGFAVGALVVLFYAKPKLTVDWGAAVRSGEAMGQPADEAARAE